MGNTASLVTGSGAIKIGSGPDSEVAESILKTINSIIVAIVALVSASICGGGGTAILMAGPIGWLLGLIIGAVAAGLLLRYGREKAKAMIKNQKISPYVLYPILTDSAIRKCEKQMREKLASDFLSQNVEISTQIFQNLEKTIQHEIAKLNEFHAAG